MAIPLAIMGLFLGLGIFGLVSSTNDDSAKAKAQAAAGGAVIAQQHLEPDCDYSLVLTEEPSYRVTIAISHLKQSRLTSDLHVGHLPLPDPWSSKAGIAIYRHGHLRIRTRSGILDLKVSPDLEDVSRIDLAGKSGTKTVCEVNQTIETF